MRQLISVPINGTRRPLIAVGVALASAALPLTASAQSADALLDKLVDKGVLTVEEANELREQSDKDFTKAYQVKSGMPDWVTSLRLNGDFRGRFEGFYADHPGFVDRNRFRYRLRFGVTATLADDFEVGFRLGSGDVDNAAGITRGEDPISSNQTFQNNASGKGVFLDTAYAKWSPLNTPEWSGALTVGKMENPFVFSDLVFDSDYTPEGFAQQTTYTLNRQNALKLTAGQFVLDEIGGSGKDPFLLAGQARLESVWNPKLTTSVGGSLLSILNRPQLTSAAVPDINTGNSRNVIPGAGSAFTLGAPTSGFQTLVTDASMIYTLDAAPFYAGPFPVRVFGDYLYNTLADDANSGFQAGVTFGKAGKRRTWELTYRWKQLEGDVWYEELTDSDSGAFYAGPFSPAGVPSLRAPGTGYGSGTNIRGHVVKATYSPYDSLALSVTWFALDLVDEYAPGSSSDMNRLQVDAVWKF